MPALEALDRYTILGTHEQTTCSDHSLERSAPVRYWVLSALQSPPTPRLLSVKPRSHKAGAFP